MARTSAGPSAPRGSGLAPFPHGSTLPDPPSILRGVRRLVLGIALGVVGCADPGDERWAGWETFKSATGGYQFRYPSPPFDLANDVPDGQGHIKVESSHDEDVPPGLP